MRTILLLLLFALPVTAQQRFKNTIPATNAWTPIALPAKLYDLTVYNVSASTLYIHVFDTNSLPSNGAFPTLAPIALPANSTASYQFFVGRSFTNGITIAASTTPITLTNGTASFKMDISYGGSQ